MKLIAVRLEKEKVIKLNELAKKEDRSRESLIRKVLCEYLERVV